MSVLTYPPAPAVFARFTVLWILAVAGLFASSIVAPAQQKPDAAVIAHGRYLATAGDCQACHTTDPAKPMAGGYPVTTPVGTIYSANITPDNETGIGTWTDDDFVRSLQQGIAKDGSNLYPAFPYDSYTLLSRDDILAIKAYLFSLKPIHQAVPANRLIFPFNQRWILWGWKLLNLRDTRFQPDSSKSPAWNRGAYLVEALEHCGTCHTPRTLTMGMDTRRKLSGGSVGPWMAFNVTPDLVSGIGQWSENDLISYLSSGIASGKAWAAGPMAEAVEHSLAHLTREDLKASVLYLRDQKPIPDAGQRQPRFAFGQPANYEATLRGASGLTDSATAANGAELYSGNCASCHQATGAGSSDGYFPPLLHNSTVGAPTANNLVMVMLNGVARDAAGKLAFMPAFAGLSDGDIASLATYVEQQFGDPLVHVTAGQVAGWRELQAPNLPDWEIVAAIAACVIALMAVVTAVFITVRRSGRRAAHG
jgi:mono/diheme cytochrome c family protein